MIEFAVTGWRGWLLCLLVAVHLPGRLVGVRALKALPSGIEISTVDGRSMEFRWDEVKRFRRGAFGTAQLDAAGRRFIAFVPRAAAMSLIALLREASDARISGFDES